MTEGESSLDLFSTDGGSKKSAKQKANLSCTGVPVFVKKISISILEYLIALVEKLLFSLVIL